MQTFASVGGTAGRGGRKQHDLQSRLNTFGDPGPTGRRDPVCPLETPKASKGREWGGVALPSRLVSLRSVISWVMTISPPPRLGMYHSVAR